MTDARFAKIHKVLNLIHKIHWSNMINRILELPLKGLWFRAMYRTAFSNGLPVCFVYLDGKYAADDYGFTDYVRRKDPRNRQIIVYFDLISKRRYSDFEEIRDRVDLVFSHDQGESEEYNLLLDRRRTYSAITSVTEPESFSNDVFFIGYAKDRLDDIVAVHAELVRRGFRCNFLVLGVPYYRRTYDGLQYLDKPIPYRQSLELLKASKCVLEIVQHGSNSPTLRAAEAVMFRRKLLTNADPAAAEDFYNPAQTSFFSRPGSIDSAFLEEPMRYHEFASASLFSPIQRLLYYDEFLEKTETGEPGLDAGRA